MKATLTPYTITTPRGCFKISREFSNIDKARAAGFGYYFTNDDGREILSRSKPEGINSKEFATINPEAEEATNTENQLPVHVYRDKNGAPVFVYADGNTERATVETLQSITADETTPATIKKAARDILADIERETKQESARKENCRRCEAVADELDELAAGALIICPKCGAIISADFAESADGESVQPCPECGEIIAEDKNGPRYYWRNNKNARSVNRLK